MPDDDFIDLLKTPSTPGSDSSESEPAPEERDSLTAFLIGVAACFAPIALVFVYMKDRHGGMPIVAMLAYTAMVPYALSNRYLRPVPWALLNRFRERFVLLHFLALAVVYGITTFAFAVKPRLPVWFVTSGRKGSLFDFCLVGVFLGLALWESSWISAHKDEPAT